MQLQDLVRDYGRTLVEALVGCCFLAATWAAQRTKRWLLELVDRERQRGDEQIAKLRASEMKRHNETLRTLSEASVTGERPNLADLLANEPRNFELESSPPPFEVPTSPAGARPPVVTPIRSLPSLTLDTDDDPPTRPLGSPRNGR